MKWTGEVNEGILYIYIKVERSGEHGAGVLKCKWKEERKKGKLCYVLLI